jgi:hypothetical protein
VEPGVPQTSKRSTARGSGGDAKNPPKNPPKSNGATKSTAKGGRRPVDPRTEDPSAPTPRPGKTVWRRPGAAGWRSSRQSDNVVDVPIDFSVAMPLAPAAEPAETDELPLAIKSVAPVVALPTVEVQPDAPDAWTTTEAVPTDPAPTALAPSVEEAKPTLPILYDQAATIEDVTQIGPVLDRRPLRRPIQFRRAPRPRVRRVTRVVRHVDTWSVFKVALVFSAFFYAVSLVAGVLLWQVAYATGTIDNVEKFFEGFGWQTFKFNGGQIYHNAWIAGLFVALGLTGLAVLLATLFNLITDLVGGIRLSVLEEEVRSREERGTVAPPIVEVVDAPIDAVEEQTTELDAPTEEPPTLAVESG